MAIVLEEELPGRVTTQSRPPVKPKLAGRLHRHANQYRADFLAAGLLAILTAVTRIWNLAGYPRWFTDEGVYVSQAWAVQYEHQLAPYTYWYDHPPLGWIQIAGWGLLTGAWQRNPNASIMTGREFVVVMAVTSVVLVYVLARRLGLRQAFAVMAGAMYCLSPLVIAYSRYVLLDNIAITWLLGAMVLALSPKRRMAAVFGSCLCLAIAALSKETILLTAPAVFWMLWHNFRFSPNWKMARLVFLTVTPIMCGFYLLYAWIKNELLPGPGHVSLWQGQVLFQLASRSGSGSIFDSQSSARLLIRYAWLGLDPWLPVIGVIAILPALFIPKLRGVAIALGLQVAILLRGGYLPYPFIISLLPFMALLAAGVADRYWPTEANWRRTSRRAVAATTVTLLAFAIVGGLSARSVASAWPQTLMTEFTAKDTSTQKQAIKWVESHLPKSASLVTEGELWTDLRRGGFNSPEIIWTFKVDTDPAVRTKAGGVALLDYLILNQGTINISSSSYPTLTAAVKRATTIASFGPDGPNRIIVMKVNHRIKPSKRITPTNTHLLSAKS